MNVRADSLATATSRPLALRRRPDLEASRRVEENAAYWVLKDGVMLRYYRLNDVEHALWQLLDGRTSLDQLREALNQRFAPRQFEVDDVYTFVGHLHQSGLVLSDAPDQGSVFYARDQRQRRQRLTQLFMQPLSIRLRGFDPDWLLTRLCPYVGWFFSRWCVLANLVLMLAALVWLGAHFDEFQSRLPTMQGFFTIENAFLLSAVLGATKILHEFGHGLACKRLGGECHEMGVMLLIFTPCLYCDVSDSWMLPSRWKRAAIGAAGMYVELALAAAATFFWWFSKPGLFHHLCLNVMLICSVSTVVFNANPLMRYDGYYILSDWLQIPNLRQLADQTLSRLAAWLCLGIELPRDPAQPAVQQRTLFAAFSLASFFYKWSVTFSILWFLNKFLEPYGLDAMGRILALVSFGLMIGVPLWKLSKFLTVPGRWMMVKKYRLGATAAVAAVLLALAAWYPLPHRVWATLVIEPRDAAEVFVVAPGTLAELHAVAGQQVDEGAVLARLEDPVLARDLIKLSSEVASQEIVVDNLWRQRVEAPDVAAQLPHATEQLQGLEERLTAKQLDARQLILAAPRAGVVMHPPAIPARKGSEEGLSTWTGSPLDRVNRRAHLAAGAVLCTIGDPERLQAVLVIDQGDVEFIAVGQHAWLQFECDPGALYEGTVAAVAEQQADTAPAQLAGKSGGRLATETDKQGRERPLSTSYVASIPLDNSQGLLRPGLRGRAKVEVGTQSLLAWGWRVVAHTFRFEL